MSAGSLCRRLLTLLALCLCVLPAAAQDAEDEVGNWLIYNGTLRFADRWSVFTEAQLRLYEMASNPQEAFVRTAGQYNLNPNALVALGYRPAEVTRMLSSLDTAGLSTEALIREALRQVHSG